MKLLTKALEAQLPPIFAQDGKGDDAIVYAKFFHCLSGKYWYATEYDAENREFFGWVYSGQFSELGYFSLTEMEQTRIKGIPTERDLYFKPCTLREIKQGHGIAVEDAAEVTQ